MESKIVTVPSKKAYRGSTPARFGGQKTILLQPGFKPPTV